MARPDRAHSSAAFRAISTCLASGCSPRVIGGGAPDENQREAHDDDGHRSSGHDHGAEGHEKTNGQRPEHVNASATRASNTQVSPFGRHAPTPSPQPIVGCEADHSEGNQGDQAGPQVMGKHNGPFSRSPAVDPLQGGHKTSVGFATSAHEPDGETSGSAAWPAILPMSGRRRLCSRHQEDERLLIPVAERSMGPLAFIGPAGGAVAISHIWCLAYYSTTHAQTEVCGGHMWSCACARSGVSMGASRCARVSKAPVRGRLPVAKGGRSTAEDSLSPCMKGLA